MFKNDRKNVKSAKINACLKGCCIVSEEGMNCCRPQPFSQCATIQAFFWCDCPSMQAVFAGAIHDTFEDWVSARWLEYQGLGDQN